MGDLSESQQERLTIIEGHVDVGALSLPDADVYALLAGTDASRDVVRATFEFHGVLAGARVALESDLEAIEIAEKMEAANLAESCGDISDVTDLKLTLKAMAQTYKTARSKVPIRE